MPSVTIEVQACLDRLLTGRLGTNPFSNSAVRHGFRSQRAGLKCIVNGRLSCEKFVFVKISLSYFPLPAGILDAPSVFEADPSELTRNVMYYPIKPNRIHAKSV